MAPEKFACILEPVLSLSTIRSGRLTRTVTVLGLVCIADSLWASETARFQIVARTGQSGLTTIDRETSINNGGLAAFIGRLPDTQTANKQNIFVGNGSAGDLTNISPGLTSERSQTVGPGVQINDRGEVLVNRYYAESSPLGPIPFSFLEVWNAYGVGQHNTLVYGEALYGDIDRVYSYPSLNNGGGTVFMGLDNGSNLIGTLTGHGGFLAGLGGETRRPMMADNDTFVMRSGSSPYSIRLLDHVFNLVKYVAGADNGFSGTELGRSPGISDDGSVVAFCGKPGTPEAAALYGPGRGIFVAFRKGDGWEYRKVAGLRHNGYLDPGETYTDHNGNGKFDPDSEVDEGSFSEFFLDERIGVNNKNIVAFLAIDDEGNKCIYETTFGVVTGSGRPRLVTKTGDSLPGLGQIDDLSIYDPLTQSTQPEVVFWAKIAGGQEAVAKWTDPIDVVAATMIDDHRLSIQTTRNFGVRTADIIVEITLDGTTYAVSSQARTTNFNPQDPDPLIFDLKAAGVPRFKKNIRFELRLDVRLPDGSDVEDLSEVAIPLPVVMVSGIQPPFGIGGSPDGVGVFKVFTDFFEAESMKKVFGPAANVKGTPYRTYMEGTPPPYPTLYYAKYQVNTATFRDGAAGVAAAWSTAKRLTYADRFFLVGHSKGGLVARYYVQSIFTDPSSFPVLLVSTAQSPHTGAPVAAWAKYFQFAGLNYQNLLPAYNCYRIADYVSNPNIFTRWANPYRPQNAQLDDLNGITSSMRWPPQVPLVMLRSKDGGLFGGYTYWGSEYASYPGIQPGKVALTCYGDNIVPYFSQSGKTFDPNDPAQDVNRPDTMPWVPAFAGAASSIHIDDIPGSHIKSFLGQPDVSKYYFDLFSKGAW